jgi:hypothetical protein
MLAPQLKAAMLKKRKHMEKIGYAHLMERFQLPALPLPVTAEHPAPLSS